jgi:hypothetical protein
MNNCYLQYTISTNSVACILDGSKHNSFTKQKRCLGSYGQNDYTPNRTSYMKFRILLLN